MIAGCQISKELCDALGLPKHTRGFTLRCYGDELVTVECEYYPDGSFQTALAQYHLVPRTEAPTAGRFDFEAWMRERTERAHREHMQRTSRLPACAPRVYPPDQIAKFYGISHGGID
jgi:hypothetical protein